MRFLRRIYIHQLPEWPDFKVRGDRLFERLSELRFKQGRLIRQDGRPGLRFQTGDHLDSVTEDVVSTSEIEGELLNQRLVRSSVARHLGMEIGGLSHTDRNVEGIDDLTLDATQNYDLPLTSERLFTWPQGPVPGRPQQHAGHHYRQLEQDRQGPMQVVSGGIGRERVHFEAPWADLIEPEMQAFLDWFNSPPDRDGVIGAGMLICRLSQSTPSRTEMAGSPGESQTWHWHERRRPLSGAIACRLRSSGKGLSTTESWSRPSGGIWT